jgi:TolB-like protein/Tfp pilus assembly protein PilF
MVREVSRRRVTGPQRSVRRQALPVRRFPGAAPESKAPVGPTIELSVLGPFALRVGVRAVRALPKKAQALLAYLAQQRGRAVPRERLADLLWGRSGGEQARRSLRQCLMMARASLKAAGADALLADADGVSLNADRIEFDAAAFETLGKSNDPHDLERATALYRGEFLAGLSIAAEPIADWLAMERRQLAAAASDVLYRLAAGHLRVGDHDKAIAVAGRLASLDPFREDAHRLLMEALAAGGRRGDALKQHALCVDILRRDLGVAPEPQTARLAAQIRSGKVSVAARADSTETSDTAAARDIAPALPLPDKPSIAVLAFSDLNADAGSDYFIDGVVEDITIALGRVPWLFVIASSSSFSYRKADVDLRRIGAELGVRYVLRGSVRRSGDRIRIVVQLTDASRGAHIWADRFDGRLDEVFELQDRVAMQVAATIAPTLHAVEIDRAQRKPPESLTAYDLYLQAVPRFRTSLAENRAAIRLLRKAIEIDPSYATAYGFASRCYQFQKLLGWVSLTEPELEEGVRLGHLAGDIGHNDSEALWMAGLALSQTSGEVERGLALLARSLALNPNSANAWLSSCNVHTWVGEPEVAIDHFYRAQRLNPLDSTHHFRWNMLAMALLSAGRLDDAEDAANNSLSAAPNYVPGLRVKIVLCGLRGRTQEGREHVRRMLALNPSESVAWLTAFWGLPMRRNPRTLAQIIEGARRAGLPEG